MTVVCCIGCALSIASSIVVSVAALFAVVALFGTIVDRLERRSRR